MKHLVSGKTVREILARLLRLESKVFKPIQGKRARKSGNDSESKGLPAHILRLRDQQFFGEPRTGSDVRGKLKSKYPCDLDRVAMALLRLKRRKQLRKTSKIVNKKKKVAYVW